jgi:hypothetical protein
MVDSGWTVFSEVLVKEAFVQVLASTTHRRRFVSLDATRIDNITYSIHYRGHGCMRQDKQKVDDKVIFSTLSSLDDSLWPPIQ